MTWELFLGQTKNGARVFVCRDILLKKIQFTTTKWNDSYCVIGLHFLSGKMTEFFSSSAHWFIILWVAIILMARNVKQSFIFIEYITTQIQCNAMQCNFACNKSSWIKALLPLQFVVKMNRLNIMWAAKWLIFPIAFSVGKYRFMKYQKKLSFQTWSMWQSSQWNRNKMRSILLDAFNWMFKFNWKLVLFWVELYRL